GRTVVFGHGLGGTKENMLRIAGTLANEGIAAVAIDWVLHGSRAVQVSTDPAIGCASGVAFAGAPQCFAPVLSPDVAATRDNLRPSMLDGMLLARKVKACAAVNCGALKPDLDRIGYIGESLGGLLGVPIAAMSPDIKAAVLNVAGVGLVEVVTQT